MAKRKKKAKSGSEKSPARRKPAARRAAVGPRTRTRKKRVAPRKPVRPKPGRGKKSESPSAARKPSRKKSPTKKPATRKTGKRRPKSAPSARGFRRRAGFELETPETTRGLGPETGGQSGDNEGLSRSEIADSESVEELLEEGQAFEAGIVSGVENAPDADESEVRTRQFPEDDVPQEYLDED
jgi:hypothetical protein